MLEVRPTPDPSSYVKGLHVHHWKDQAQPPRYTIFPRFLSLKAASPLTAKWGSCDAAKPSGELAEPLH
jgi:hypothetical protein